MNSLNRPSLMIGMLVTLIVVFAGGVLAEVESVVDSTVAQVAHRQAMQSGFTDSTVANVAHRQAMTSAFTDSTIATVTRVTHWQPVYVHFTDASVASVAHRQSMTPAFTDSTIANVLHWQAMGEEATVEAPADFATDAVAKVDLGR